MNIIGYNCHIHDAAASLVQDGDLKAATEEERFVRKKHYGDFPFHAITYALESNNLSMEDIDYVAFYWKPFLGLHRRIYWVLREPAYFSKLFFSEKIGHAKRGGTINTWLVHLLAKQEFKKYFPGFRGKFIYTPHHLAHAASAFFISPFTSSAIISIDYSGEWASTLLGYGQGNKITPLQQVAWPHSLGYAYAAVTQYLGFGLTGDEYKVMGLSSYGNRYSKYYDKFKEILWPDPGVLFKMDLKYFGLHRGHNQWYSAELTKAFGPARQPGEEVTDKHADIAAGLQHRFEDIALHLAQVVKERTKSEYLCLAGGCALNSVANGLLAKQGLFKKIFVQPAAHDAGDAIGSAYYLYNQMLGNQRNFVLTHSFWGPEYNDAQCEQAIIKSGLRYRISGQVIPDTARLLADGKIVGWFQGRMEWGPRALGNRSILADPRIPEMKDTINIKVKHREEFRPFAPSILEEHLSEYFDFNHPAPFMLFVYNVTQPDKIPAVTHVDGTGRVQTVSRTTNPRYWDLINEFKKLTGVPVVLNTSFNDKNEPIVCSPEDAIRCFLATGMDYLAMNNYIVEKTDPAVL